LIPTTCAEGGVTLGPPMGRPGAEYGSPEWRERVSAGLRRYHERRRKVAQVAPRDLARLARDGELAPSLRPLLPIAAEEAYELTEALGGLASVSPQRRAIIEDIVAVGIVLRATLARFLQTRDHELGSKVGTLASARRASLQALGLERVAKELDLSTYLAQKAAESTAEVHQTASNEENGGDPDPAAADTEQDASARHGGGAPRQDVVHPAPAAVSTSDSEHDHVTQPGARASRAGMED